MRWLCVGTGGGKLSCQMSLESMVCDLKERGGVFVFFKEKSGC